MSANTKPTDYGDELTIKRAADMFIHHSTDNSANTNRTYDSGIATLLEWGGAETTADLTPATIQDYRAWLVRQDRENPNGHGGQYSPSTVSTYIGAVKQFLKYCGKMGWIPRQNHKVLDHYSVGREHRKAKQQIRPERLSRIVDWYKDHEPYSRNTVILQILNETGMRKVGLRAIDRGDVAMNDSGQPVIKLENRPATGTALKEPEHARHVPIKKDLFDTIKQYDKDHRIAVKDDRGREPLLTTRHGRIGHTAIQNTVYVATCPKKTGVTVECGDCDCEGKPTTKTASQCEHSVGPHACRGAAVTRMRNNGHQWADIGLLVGATGETLRLQYDYSTRSDRAEQARNLLDGL